MKFSKSKAATAQQVEEKAACWPIKVTADNVEAATRRADAAVCKSTFTCAHDREGMPKVATTDSGSDNGNAGCGGKYLVVVTVRAAGASPVLALCHLLSRTSEMRIRSKQEPKRRSH